MLSFVYMIIFGFIPLWLLLHYSAIVLRFVSKKKYNEEKRYQLALKFVKVADIFTFTKTQVYGKENIPPKEVPYLIVANHQGKYDCCAAFNAFDTIPIGMLMEIHLSKTPCTTQVMSLIDGLRIDLNNPRQQLQTIRELAERTKNGKHYVVFPEGGYGDNHNSIQLFKSGCLMAIKKAKCAVLPICLYNTFDGMNRTDYFRKVTAEVHVLPLVPYERIQNMTLDEIASYLREFLVDKMKEIHQQKGLVYVPWDKEAPTPKTALKWILKEKRKYNKTKK